MHMETGHIFTHTSAAISAVVLGFNLRKSETHPKRRMFLLWVSSLALAGLVSLVLVVYAWGHDGPVDEHYCHKMPGGTYLHHHNPSAPGVSGPCIKTGDGGVFHLRHHGLCAEKRVAHLREMMFGQDWTQEALAARDVVWCLINDNKSL